LTDGLLRVAVDQRFRCAGREGDLAVAVDLQKDVGGAERERDESVAFALERLEVALAMCADLR
jgi:hypothetical protein